MTWAPGGRLVLAVAASGAALLALPLDHAWAAPPVAAHGTGAVRAAGSSAAPSSAAPFPGSSSAVPFPGSSSAVPFPGSTSVPAPPGFRRAPVPGGTAPESADPPPEGEAPGSQREDRDPWEHEPPWVAVDRSGEGRDHFGHARPPDHVPAAGPDWWRDWEVPAPSRDFHGGPAEPARAPAPSTSPSLSAHAPGSTVPGSTPVRSPSAPLEPARAAGSGRPEALPDPGGRGLVLRVLPLGAGMVLVGLGLGFLGLRLRRG